MEVILANNPFVVLKIPGCINCLKMIKLFDSFGLKSKYTVINIADIEDIEYEEVLTFLKKETKSNMFPMIFIKTKYVGSYIEVKNQLELGFFGEILNKELNIDIDNDLP